MSDHHYGHNNEYNSQSASNLLQDDTNSMMGGGSEIGSFHFEIDDDIDTEVLKNEQVYEDLIELEKILGKTHEAGGSSSGNATHSRPKKRR